MTAAPGARPPQDQVLLTGRFARLAAALEAWPKRTVRLAELWQLWAAADPESLGQADRRTALAAAIARLAADGLASPSVAMDRSASPALPVRLTLPKTAQAPSPAELARATAWRPELCWAAAARLTSGQVVALQAVNSWLRDCGRDTDVVPLRERSLEILGHEKALDRLVRTSLFGVGRLTFELLRTFRSHPPLPAIRVGDGPVLLVVENEDTFSTLLTCARRDAGEIGWVAWGAGGAFEASVRSVGDIRPRIEIVRYFGDLDYDGLRIPANASATAAAEGLPPVLPADGLYARLLESGIPQPGQPVPDDSAIADAISWLASGHNSSPTASAATAEALLRAGRRIPQEALGIRQLAGTPLGISA
jgi:hypothetical protein